MEFKLRSFKEKDAELMLEWMHDPNVTHSLSTPFSTFTMNNVLSFIEKANNQQTENLHLACVDEKDTYLGTVSLKNICKISNKAEYAISFRRAAHGTGAAKYATQEILRIAFEELELERVYLYLYSVNERANRFYQKMGFIHEGTLRKHVFFHDELCDELWYGMLKEEWMSQTF